MLQRFLNGNDDQSAAKVRETILMLLLIPFVAVCTVDI
jgi:hypothetical protein